MQEISVTFDDGFTNTIIKTGTGPGLLIIHGWTSYVEDWTYFVKILQKEYTCFLWNARCHYQENTTITRLAEDVKYIIDYFRIKSPCLLGHSMGALTIFELVKNFGCSPFSSFIIIDQTPKIITDHSWDLGLFKKFDTTINAEFIQSLHNNFVETVISLILNSKHRKENEWQTFKKTDFYKERVQYLKTLVPRFWIDIWSDFSIKDYRSTIKSITVPTLLLYGTESKFYGPDIAQYMHKKIKNSQLHMYLYSGHNPQIEEPERFITDVMEFMKKKRKKNGSNQ